MLVLTRKPNERLTLTLPNGEVIVVAVNWLNRFVVSLAIDAPKDVHILRDDAVVRFNKAGNDVIR